MGVLVFVAIVAIIIACVVADRNQKKLQAALLGHQSQIDTANRRGDSVAAPSVPAAVAPLIKGASQWGLAVGGTTQTTGVLASQFDDSTVIL